MAVGEAGAQRIEHPLHDRRTYDLLRSIPGVGKVLALIFLYEIDDIDRFDSHQQFCRAASRPCYARLIRPKKTSAGKASGLPSHKKIGNRHPGDGTSP